MSYKKYLKASSGTRAMPRAILSSGPAYARNKERRPFGAAMAEEIFELYNEPHHYYGEDECVSDESPQSDDYEETWYQTELPLENLRELEERMRQQITKFEGAYSKMMIFALKWYYLEQDAETNPQVGKLFKDLQLTRKLAGSDTV